MKIKIMQDVYNISKRIKFIDRYYYVVYDTSKHKFEVHNSQQLATTYCLTLPYNQLDERTLKYVRQTQTANIDEILDKIENDNNSLESVNESNAYSNMLDSIEQNLVWTKQNFNMENLWKF